MFGELDGAVADRVQAVADVAGARRRIERVLEEVRGRRVERRVIVVGLGGVVAGGTSGSSGVIWSPPPESTATASGTISGGTSGSAAASVRSAASAEVPV
ncbi:hypothetical protein GS489_05475 [Rhodococcus hoagii]|nr:hypothetical protein [Prescottella equi]